jgi:hypothetical protein
VLGSSDALGNPVRLIGTLGEGLWDFITLPAIGNDNDDHDDDNNDDNDDYGNDMRVCVLMFIYTCEIYMNS